MNKVEFMSQLEYLLRDILDQDKGEVIQYYYDYFADAGEENEEMVIRELGTPERIAGIIRTDLNAVPEDSGEFTESGYSDSRYKEPSKPLTEYAQVAEYSKETDGYEKRNSPTRKQKIIAIIAMVCILFPVGNNLLKRGIGLAFAVIGSFLVLLLLPGATALAGVIGGIFSIIFGTVMMISNLSSGLMVIGFGISGIGVGLLAAALSIWVYGTALPWTLGFIKGFFKELGDRMRQRRKQN